MKKFNMMVLISTFLATTAYATNPEPAAPVNHLLTACVNVKKPELYGHRIVATPSLTQCMNKIGDNKPWIIFIEGEGVNCSPDFKEVDFRASGSCLSRWSVFTVKYEDKNRALADKDQAVMRLFNSNRSDVQFNDNGWGVSTLGMTICKNNTACGNDTARFTHNEKLYLVDNSNNF